MALATRGRFACTDDKLKMDKSCGSIDTDTALDLSKDPEEESEGTSKSSIVEMNNNTNGKILSMEHVNTNDNRQFSMQQVNFTPSVMKKIKQIYMEEVPMHLSGLSLSGSGMELYVKIDEKVDKALRTDNDSAKQKPITLKKRPKAKNKKMKKILHVTRNMSHKDIQSMLTEQCRDKGEVANLPVKKKETEIKRATTREKKVNEKKMNKRNIDAMTSDSKQIAPEHLHHLKDVSLTQHQSYNPYAFKQSFQPSSQHMINNVIKGPSWNVDNGCIDVMKSQDALPSTSKMHGLHSSPIDFSMTSDNPFPGGFKSQNLPLKRRMSPPRLQEERNCYDDCYDEYYNDNFSKNNFKRNERFREPYKERYTKALPSKKYMTKEANGQERYSQPTTSQEKLPQQTSSEISNAQSSVGPTFQADLIKPQTLDAETLIKFTEYTYAIRKDLKQKYKDLSKLVRNFEDAVQERNGAENENEESAQSQGKQCRIM